MQKAFAALRKGLKYGVGGADAAPPTAFSPIYSYS